MKNGVVSSARSVRDAGLLNRIVQQFSRGFETLHGLGPAVSVFGSARLSEGSREYELGCDLGELLANKGYAVITGGGPGLMEAANRGVTRVGGRSVGLNIQLPAEQGANRYSEVALEFEHFFARKVMFLRYSQAFFVLPGGVGTMDELFEALTLIQTGKVERKPILLLGRDFWGGLYGWIREQMGRLATISPEDLHLMQVVETAEEAVESFQAFGPSHSP